jgi:type IX secretion system PorP/SprF family membrane protein
MIFKNTFTRVALTAALALTLEGAQAQDIHFTQFDAQPLIINPAFTGMFDGQFRAAAIYRNQWRSVTIPYVTEAVSFDLPILRDKSLNNFLAAGIEIYDDKAGDGQLQNFTGLASIAYHLGFGGNGENRSSDLAFGLQGGYSQKSIDLSKLYFGDEYFNGTFNPGTSQEYHLGIGNETHYFLVNAGLSFSQALGSNFSYVLGLGANNINQPTDALEKLKNSQTGLDMRFTGEAGAIVGLSDRFSLRPAVLYQEQATATEVIAGNEFHYIVGDNTEFQNFTTALFLGGWYRSGDALMVTAGIEWKGFRLGVSYDDNTSSLNTASSGNGGFEISLRYVAPNPLTFAHKRTIPCSRF